jgi:DNA-binding Lrp family transcriptional regulator
VLSNAEQALLSLLRANARASTAELARRLGVSRTTVQSRIERLEQRGIITGYGVRLSPDYEQGLVRAHVLLTVTPKLADKVVRSLHALPPPRNAGGTAPPLPCRASPPSRGEIGNFGAPLTLATIL